METRFLRAADGTSTAYDVHGSGPPILLLHGAGQTRRDWRTAEYVSMLQAAFTVITLDLPGIGDSKIPNGKPIIEADEIVANLLNVADACGMTTFSVAGFSLGGMIALQLAAHTGRLAALAVISTPLRTSVDEMFVDYARRFRQKWEPVLAAMEFGGASSSNAPAHIPDNLPGWVRLLASIAQWPPINFDSISCPILLISGTEDPAVARWQTSNPTILQRTSFEHHTLKGLDHEQTFHSADRVTPEIIRFLCACASHGAPESDHTRAPTAKRGIVTRLI
jgi:pimeloyl-ACP methyl ester carboxylesterase